MRLAILFLCTVTITMATQNAQQPAELQLAHIVFFKLKDDSAEAARDLVSACNKYLSGHDGTVYFSAGTRGEEFQREVNDRQFDVALHVVFKTKADHDRYQDDSRHLQFISENKDNWASVRVFDSYLGAN